MAALMLQPAGCTLIGEPEVVAGGPKTVTFKWAGGAPPHDAAKAYCDAYGREAVYQGGIELGQVSTGNMYAYDCVERDGAR